MSLRLRQRRYIQTKQMIRGIAILLVSGGIVLALVIWNIVHAEDPARRLFKWILTVPGLFLLFGVAGPIVAKGGYTGAFAGVPLAAISGLYLAIIWRYDIAAFFASPVASLYDGGTEPPERRALYSKAIGLRKNGRYQEALYEIRKELDQFPLDVEGHLLFAQIQAEDLNDLAGAELTIARYIQQPELTPGKVVAVLYAMADLYLKPGRDPDAARRQLEKVIDLYPNSEYSLAAAQRIAHLASAESMLARDRPTPLPVPQREQRVGLRPDYQMPVSAEKDPATQAVEYVKHLEQHPLDTEAREKLAVLYTDHYGRLDLAMDQLEQMIHQPHQPAKKVVHWLNLLADLQVRGGADYDTVRETLQRIIDREPNLAAAETARKRIDLLKLELKAKEKSQDVQLGTYEQKIGLKRRGSLH